MPGIVPGPGDITENQNGKFPHQWSSHFSKGRYTINKKINKKLSDSDK